MAFSQEHVQTGSRDKGHKSRDATMQHLNSKQLSKTVTVCVQWQVKGGGRERNYFVFGLNSYHVFGGTVTRLRVKTETKEQLK